MDLPGLDINPDYPGTDFIQGTEQQPQRFGYGCRSPSGALRQGNNAAAGENKIGRRRVDTHFIGFKKTRARFEYVARRTVTT